PSQPRPATPFPSTTLFRSGLVFHIVSIALPKIVDERVGADVPLLLVGGLASAVFMCGALAQLAVGRLVEKFPPHILFAMIASLQDRKSTRLNSSHGSISYA